MRLAFLGSGAFGLPTLEALHAGHELCAIVTQPDRPAGRKRVPTPTPVGAWAASHAPGVPLMKPEDLNADEPRAMLRDFDADAWVIIAFGQKLSERLLDGVFAINLHASLLPRWRGAAPIHRAIEAGDDETGNSVITIAQRMDAGDVLAQTRRPIEPHHTTGDLHDLLASDGPGAILTVLDQHARGAVVRTQQDESLVTRARKLTKAEGTTDFALPADAVRARIHAFNPWPGVTVLHHGSPIKLHRARTIDRQTTAAPGTVLDAQAGHVACARGALEMLSVQPANKPAMAWSEFVNGHSIKAGERLEPMTP
ncbi:MAG: methionyl-tRNA formyltransferase [Phycisphaerales bacterium]